MQDFSILLKKLQDFYAIITSMNWNLKTLYKSEKDPQIQKDIEQSKKANTSFISKWSKNKRYLQDPKTLLQAIQEYEKLEEKYGQCQKPLYYLSLRTYLNQTDPNIKGILNKLSQTATEMVNNIQFFELNISKIPKEEQSKFLNYKGLTNYKHYLERLFLVGKYLLSDNEEKVFNLMSKTSHSNWENMLSELLDKQKFTVLNEKGKKQKITYNKVSKYLNSTNKKVRDYANKEFNKVNSKYAEIAEFEINSILEAKKISDNYRKIPRPDLTRHITDDIDSTTVDTLVKVVTDNFYISQQYYEKKAKLLGLKKLGYHERNIPLKSINTPYPYDKGMKLVKETFSSLDLQFGDILNSFENENIYDVYPKNGKSGGAFCISVSNSLPTYILLNHADRLNDVLTIAHESGHGIHSILSKKQSELNSGHPISLAEVASTFFEDFVLEKILKETNNKGVALGILDNKLNGDISSIFRQIAFYNFEKELHETFREKGFIPKEEISEIFCKHMKAYLGDAVEEDESMRNGWVYVSHFRNFFYVYSYASGLLISKALQKMIKENPRDISLVKTFLESGGSKSPKILFKEMGIDISKEEIWEKGIDAVRTLLMDFSL